LHGPFVTASATAVTAPVAAAITPVPVPAPALSGATTALKTGPGATLAHILAAIVLFFNLIVIIDQIIDQFWVFISHN
jgi:hypothetical protein